MVVNYLNDRGENKSWKLMNFSNPKVFDVLKGATQGQMFDVVTRKNDKDFTEWAAITQLDATVTAPTPAKTTPYKSSYETPEERAARQVLIVKQSCLAQAVALASVGAKTPPEADNVLALAEKFKEWVFATETFVDDESLEE